ncbi:MAG: cytochrome c biogenesis protein CcsA [Verrucomicrobiales bacterium]|nr:cytochrome c biogenesis protein CcsA [Verrucomicrobiales bacterium]
MKRALPWIVAALAVLAFAGKLYQRPEKSFQVREFGRLPVLLSGRVQPLDSVARNSLLQLRTKQTVRVIDRQSGEVTRTLSATEWLQEALFQPEVADTRLIFRVDHPEVVAMLKVNREPSYMTHLGARHESQYYSFAEILPAKPDVEHQAGLISESGKKPEQQTPFEKAVMGLANRLMLYQRIKSSLKPETVQDMGAFLASLEKAMGPGRAAAEAQREGKAFDQAALDALIAPLTLIERVSRVAYPLMIPIASPGHDREDWANAGHALMDSVRQGTIPEPIRFYASMNDAYRKGDAATFNQAVATYSQWLGNHQYAQELAKGRHEHLFNHLQLFYHAMVLYVGALLCAFISWFNRNEFLRRTGVTLSVVAILIHTAGLVYRMVLEGRPPVTNLYSSAIFIGWGTVLLGLALERFYRDGIGTVVGAVTGFTTLVVAHNLATSGDTMALLQAVLDTNFWLATHVVVVTLGYSASFVAGFLAVLYVLRGFFTSSLTKAAATALARMVYGVICFAMLFSFVGTVLGGIWADQSWGRFWGWDPKENGALLIVIWNAVYLHARWGKLLSEKALMAVAIFGNIVTAFSWFGVNMLGIGLHSYGFMDAAFKWLMVFDVTQVILIALALLPLRYWRSFRHAGPDGATPERHATKSPKPPQPMVGKPRTA